MDVSIVIPARYQSSRFPGKPLQMLEGASGVKRSLIRRAWDAAQAVDGISRVVVATDDGRIADHARDFGAEVMMTSKDARNGTERCAELAEALGGDLIVNLQGDAPLTPADFVSSLLEGIGDADVATPVLKTDPQTLAHFKEDRKEGRVGGTTAVFGADNNALYFSKEVLPYADAPGTTVYHHVGLYAYRPAALKAYAGWEMGRLEDVEGLEQLRFLENGVKVKCVEVEGRGRVFWELNNPVDVPRIEAAMKEMGMA
ncbi:3-deoxy-manno-octulosonate cytidylyltransferase [Paracoccaceae bacterium GXU_MW_L88]